MVVSRKFKLIIGSILVVALLLVYFFFDPTATDSYFPGCPLYNTTGIYCPGCGSQRALHSLLHLDFKSVLSYNLLFIPATGVVLYNVFVRIYNRVSSRQIPNVIYTKTFAIIVLIVILIFWVLRNLPIHPFNHLAP